MKGEGVENAFLQQQEEAVHSARWLQQLPQRSYQH